MKFPLVVPVFAAVVVPSAFAAAPDFSSSVSSIDWAYVSIGIVAIAALHAGYLVVGVGANMILRAIRSQ